VGQKSIKDRPAEHDRPHSSLNDEAQTYLPSSHNGITFGKKRHGYVISHLENALPPIEAPKANWM